MARTRKPSTVSLHPDSIAAVQSAMQMIAAKEAELALMRLGLEQLIAKHSGVNLVAENWSLDTDHWTLSKES